MKLRLTRLERTYVIILLLGVITLCVSSVIVNVSSRNFILTKPDLPTAQTGIVLGAAIFSNGTLTPVLKDRAETAVELYSSGKIKKILVSGDNSKPSHNEVVPVGKYLIERGVAKDDIFLDYAGFDTYDTMYRAKTVFKVDSAIIVTQSFHLPRAVFLARRLGIDAVGYSSDKRQYYLRNYVREYFADAKAVFNVMVNSKPTYLGETVPVSGPGNTP